MAFPTPFDGNAALYPLTIAKRYPVAVLKFTDGTEQRYRQAAGLNAFTLELSEITAAEKDAIVDFFETVKGSFDATWDLVLAGTTYGYMAFADDKIEATEGASGVWSMSVRLVQTRKN